MTTRHWLLTGAGMLSFALVSLPAGQFEQSRHVAPQTGPGQPLLLAQLDSGKAADREEAQAKMRHWQQDSDFASVRGEQALAALSQQERLAWASLWRDVAALLELASRK